MASNVLEEASSSIVAVGGVDLSLNKQPKNDLPIFQ
jgi:hypothetical protein